MSRAGTSSGPGAAPSRALAAAASGTLLFLAGCSDDSSSVAPQEVSAEVTPRVATVVNVRWKTATPSVGYVEYGPTEALGFKTPLEDEPALEHELPLLGLTSDTQYYYRVVIWDDGDAGRSGLQNVRTGDLPVGLPQLDRSGTGHDQFIIVPILGRSTGVTAVTILNPEGDIVWYQTDDRDLDFYRARLARDGKSVLYNAASISGNPAENSELVRVALDGSSQDSTPIPLLAHDFVELPDGTLTAMVVEYRDFEGERLRGDQLVEVSPSGDLTPIWSSWDCFDPAVHQGDDPEQGWTFGNALDYDPAEDAYYLGMRNFSSIAKIPRGSRSCEWVFGLVGSTITFAPGSQRFLHQHQFQMRGNRIVILDNDGDPDASRVLEFELDFERNVATQVWSYVSNPSVRTFVLGEPTRFDNGDTFINWSAAGQMERVTSAGAVSWQINAGIGTVFGFHTLAETLYPAGGGLNP